MRRTKYRTFLDLMSECRPALHQFYVVIEQIPIWFNAQAEKGYGGGTTISNRPRVETFLKDLFGESGNAAIHLYVLHHYATMFQKQNRETVCGSADYLRQFKYDIWWDLGYILLGKWKAICRWDEYVSSIEKYKHKTKVRFSKCILDDSHLQDTSEDVSFDLPDKVRRMISGSKELRQKYDMKKADVKEIADTVARRLKVELENKMSRTMIKVYPIVLVKYKILMK